MDRKGSSKLKINKRIQGSLFKQMRSYRAVTSYTVARSLFPFQWWIQCRVNRQIGQSLYHPQLLPKTEYGFLSQGNPGRLTKLVLLLITMYHCSICARLSQHICSFNCAPAGWHSILFNASSNHGSVFNLALRRTRKSSRNVGS